MTNDRNAEPGHSLQRAGASSPQKRLSLIPYTNIQISTNVSTVEHKEICSVQNHPTKPSSVQCICTARLILSDGPTWDFTINLDIGHPSVASSVRIRNMRDFSAPEDGTVGLTFASFALREVMKKGNNKKQWRKRNGQNEKS